MIQKQQVFLVKNSIFIEKEETSMKHLLYNEGNLEGVKTEVWGTALSSNKTATVSNLSFLSV